MLVSLRLIEAADDGPNDVARRSDELREEGGALAWAQFVGVELEDEVLQVVELVLRQSGGDGEVVGGGGGGGGGGGVVMVVIEF